MALKISDRRRKRLPSRANSHAFDLGRGDVFVCRFAGNFADVNSIASFEYAVAWLGTPFILVLGHSNYGVRIDDLSPCPAVCSPNELLHIAFTQA
jgi:hypothetical protein